jgi:hypothetical protein
MVVTLQYLGSQNSVGFHLLGEDFAVSSDVVEFDFDHLFLVVAAVD